MIKSTDSKRYYYYYCAKTEIEMLRNTLAAYCWEDFPEVGLYIRESGFPLFLCCLLWDPRHSKEKVSAQLHSSPSSSSLTILANIFAHSINLVRVLARTPCTYKGRRKIWPCSSSASWSLSSLTLEGSLSGAKPPLLVLGALGPVDFTWITCT